MEPLALSNSHPQAPPVSTSSTSPAMMAWSPACLSYAPPQVSPPGAAPALPPPGEVSSYEASVVATSLLPPGEAWHPMLSAPASTPAQQWMKDDDHHPAVHPTEIHNDSGISPGRDSSGPSSNGGSPPGGRSGAEPPAFAAEQQEAHSPARIKTELQDHEDECQSSPITHDDDSSDISEDTMDSLSRLQMALTQSGSPLGDIYNNSAPSLNEDGTPSIPCSLCNHVCNTIPALAKHLSSHAEHKSLGDSPEETVLQCPLCRDVAPSLATLEAHLTNHFALDGHVKTHRMRRCSVCDFSTKSASKMRSHLADVHGFAPGENEGELTEEDVTVPRVNSQGKVKTFRCKQCDFVAVTKLDFWSHSRNHIKSEKVLACPRCPFVTEYKHHLEYHLRNHSGSKPFKCTQCSYSCVNKSMLNSHLKSHSNVYQYRCTDCNYATKYCHSLKLHLRKYNHTPAMVLNPDGSPNPLPIIDVYGTRRGPKAKKESQNHQNSNNSAQNLRKSPINFPSYSTGPAAPQNQPFLVSPAPFSEETIRCMVCEFSTTSREQFAHHMMTVHSNGIPKPNGPAPIVIPTPEKILQHQQQHQILVSQPNPMKDYLSWMYAQQKHAMDLYQQYKDTVPEPIINLANPLDLSKEMKKVTQVSEHTQPISVQPGSPPNQTPPNKNRRKGKAFKLERIALRLQQDDLEEENDARPPPAKIPNNGPAIQNNTPNVKISVPTKTPPPHTNGVTKNNEPQQPPQIVATVKENGCHEEQIDPKKVPSSVPCNGAPSPVGTQTDVQPTYNCSYCDILFRDVVMYTMHMGYHGYKDPFHCNMCGQVTTDRVSFFLHIARSSHC